MAACGDGTTSGSNDSSGGSNGNSGGGLSGNRGGSVQGQYVSVTITSTGWSLSTSGFSDYGTYTMDGITARLRSTQYNLGACGTCRFSWFFR
jgi:hypothetical protein